MLIIQLIISSLSLHNLNLLLCILSIFYFDIVLMALFCAAIRIDSFSLLSFPFLSHVHVFSCKISLVCRLKCSHSCFFSHFCLQIIFVLLMLVLSILFLVTTISLPLRFFNVVFWNFFRCINFIFNAGESSSSSFSWQSVCLHHLWDVRPYA